MQLPISSAAHAWFMSNLPEIQSRSNACFARLTPDRRQEAEAEIAAVIFKAVDSAARRGVIARITPFHLVNNATRQFRGGRRIAGSSVVDVMGEGTQRKGRVVVMSLSRRSTETGDDQSPCLSERLADRHTDQRPEEQVRVKLDYAEIFRREQVSPKAQRVFELLSTVRSVGRGAEIARALGVSPGRVSQLKKELADALSRHGYRPGLSKMM